MLHLVFVACSVGLVSAAPQIYYDLDQAQSHFQDFKDTYNKQYSSDNEHETRFNVFKENLVKINEQNILEDDVVFGVTEFSDLTTEEFISTYTCHIPADSLSCGDVYTATDNDDPVPDEHDWRKFNKVTRVKNQKNCGSCWAFSTTGNLESHYAMVHNELKEFSESQLVDCDIRNLGCDGGSYAESLAYVQQSGGIMSEQDYPYEPKRRDCKFNHTKVAAQVAGCNRHVVHSEEELKKTLYRVGPLSIENDVPYWIIKNSWGEDWGEAGYVRVRRNVNACNIMGDRRVFVTAVMK